MGFEKGAYDIEHIPAEKHRSSIAPDDTGAVHGESFIVGDTLYARIQSFVGRYGVEQRGIERVPEDERSDKNIWKVGTMVGPQKSEAYHQMLTFLSGWQPTWLCPPSLLGLWQFQSLRLVSWTLF